jgi:hypothetical protein
MKQDGNSSTNKHEPQILQRINIYVRNIHNLSVVLVREERLYGFQLLLFGSTAEDSKGLACKGNGGYDPAVRTWSI